MWRGGPTGTSPDVDLPDGAPAPAVQRNVETVRPMGVRMVGPAAGRLACGTEGVGRMAEPRDIFAALDELAAAPLKP